MSKFSVSISGSNNIGSIAIGPNAVAKGAVSVPSPIHKEEKCNNCGAPHRSDLDKCNYCRVPYGKSGNISITMETE